MRKCRFSEEQIIAILKAEAEEETAWEAVFPTKAGRHQRSGVMPEARAQRCGVLQMAFEVWRYESLGRKAAETA